MTVELTPGQRALIKQAIENGRITREGGRKPSEKKRPRSGCYHTDVAAVIAGTRTWDEATPPNQFCK